MRMAHDIFIKLSGIVGESQDASHKDEIDVLRWNWNIHQESSMHQGSGGGTSKATVGDLHFDHYLDRASPNLLKYCLTGKHLETATLVARKAGGTPLEYLRITMNDVIVTSVVPVVNTNMARLREGVSLSFAKVRVEYVIQNQQGGSAGTVEAGFDIQANQEI
jgi:type VI secretion system secreted protein Hcp